MKGGFGNLLKQAQQMQEDFKRAQEDLANVEITGESGGGMVKVVMTGRHDVRRVTLDPALLKEEKEMLEDLWRPPSTTRTGAWSKRVKTNSRVSPPGWACLRVSSSPYVNSSVECEPC